MKADARRLLGWLESAVALVAAIVMLVAGGVFALERSGRLTGLLARELDERTGGAAAFESVHVDWRRAALVVRGLHLVSAPDDGRLDEVAIEPRLARGAPVHVVVRGGMVRVGPELVRALEALPRPADPEGADTPATFGSWPAVTATNVRVELPEFAGATMGVDADVWLVPRARGGAELRALLAPRFGGAHDVDGTLAVHGSLDAEGRLEAELATLRFAVPEGALPEAAWFSAVGLSEVGGALAVRAGARVDLARREPPTARLELALDELRWKSEDPLFVADGASLRAVLSYAPDAEKDPLDPRAVSGEVAVAALWNGGPVEIAVRLGGSAGEGRVLRLDLVVPNVPLASPLTLRTAMACTAPRTSQALAEAWEALEPAGTGGLHLAAELDERSLHADAGEHRYEPRVALHGDLAGSSALRFTGWLNDDGTRNGFPVRVQEVDGRLVLLHEPWDARRDRFGMLGLTGAPPSGAVRAHGAIISPDRDWTVTKPEVRLVVEIDELAVDEDLPTGVAGLGLGFDPLGPYGVAGGRASGVVGFEQLPRNEGMRLCADVIVRGTSARIDAAGVGARDVDGELALRFARSRSAGGGSARPFGAAFAFVGDLEASGASEPDAAPPRAIVRGTWRESDPAGPDRGESFAARVELERVHLAGATSRALVARHADAALAQALLAVRGEATVRANASRPGGHAEGHVALAVRVADVASSEPEAFGIAEWRVESTAVVAGDALAMLGGSAAAGAPSLRAAARAAGPLLGDARGAAVAALVGEEARVSVAASGIDPTAPHLRAELARLAAAPETPADETLLGDELALVGRFDAHASLHRAGTGVVEHDLAVDLRDATLVSPGFALTGIDGRVRLAGGAIAADRLDARFGDTPLVLDDVHLWLKDADGSWRGPPPPAPHPASGVHRALLTGRLSFVDLRLDGSRLPLQHAEPGAGPPWRADLDAHGVEVQVALGGPDGLVAWVAGDVIPHDVRIHVGVPIGISSARVRLERVVVADGDARGWGRADDVYANVAGRAIEAGRLVATYAAGRLTVDDLHARVAGGTVTSLGAPSLGPGERPAEVGGRALAVDLVEGGRFDLAIAFDRLQVRPLLAGLVAGDQAAAGRVDGTLRLAGLPRDPRSLRGGGRMRVQRARLGSVPVARAVFTALGFDATATFDRGDVRFDVGDATVRIENVTVQSPLLKLVGTGWMGLDGRLSVDLDVEYGLIDALGFLGRLVYWVQNQILRVSVRGDMARPIVRARNVLADLFGGPGDDAPLLPLPPMPPAPERF